MIQRCQTQFSSRDSGRTLTDIERQQSSNAELRQFLEEATAVMRSHGNQLVQILKNVSAPSAVVGGADVTDGDVREEVDGGRDKKDGPTVLVLTRTRISKNRR